MTPLIPVLDANRRCIGHILARGRGGFEAYDRDDQSCGTFRTLGDAANTVIVALERTLAGLPS